jgi:hypothetical protein
MPIIPIPLQPTTGIYSWITLAQAISALQGKLQNSTFWTSAELQVYLNEALRFWNALTEQWNADFAFTASGSTWANTGSLTYSPRLRSVTDAYLYTQMQYMLLEPPTGAGTWTGTNQFDLASMQYALDKRRNEVIQASGCNLGDLPLSSTPNQRRVVLPDTVLEPKRLRFVPATNFGNPITLTREDTQAFQYFESAYLQTDQTPQSWSVPSEPPLAFDVDFAPNIPGTYDMIALQSGPTFTPPSPSLLGIPDDWSWLPMYGALADLLGSESERTDRERAAYCLRRFTDGLTVMRNSNWLVQANINGQPCDTPSLFEQDCYSPEWQNNSNAWPAVVQAGMDLVAASPTSSQSVNVTLVGNAPIPVLSGNYIQASRDVFDVILSYAQRLASFKEAGEEFMATEVLEKDFYRAAKETNHRLIALGIFTDELHSAGKREDVQVPRAVESTPE